jgi:hypothetical protein
MEHIVHTQENVEWARALAPKRETTLSIDATYAGYAANPADPNVVMYYVYDSGTGEYLGDITYDYGVWAFCTPEFAPCYSSCVRSYVDAVWALSMVAYLSSLSYDNHGA